MSLDGNHMFTLANLICIIYIKIKRYPWASVYLLFKVMFTYQIHFDCMKYFIFACASDLVLSLTKYTKYFPFEKSTHAYVMCMSLWSCFRFRTQLAIAFTDPIFLLRLGPIRTTGALTRSNVFHKNNSWTRYIPLNLMKIASCYDTVCMAENMYHSVNESHKLCIIFNFCQHSLVYIDQGIG